MPHSMADAVSPLPRWLVVLASLAIVAHLVAIGGRVLSAQSGPWVTQMGPSQAVAPEFAQEIDRVCSPSYLKPLRMTHDYHFPSNRPELPGVYFEAILKDEAGKVTKTIRFPDDRENFWIRQRQLLLARALADDIPVQPPPGEAIAAPRQQAPSVEIWDLSPDKTLRLRSVPEHLVPRDHPVFRASEWSKILARAYGRYLCRVHGAASAQVFRHTKEPMLSGALLVDEASPEELVAAFEEVKR